MNFILNKFTKQILNNNKTKSIIFNNIGNNNIKRYYSNNKRMNKAKIEIFPEIESATAQVLIIDETTKKCAILDSVLNYAQNSGKTSTKDSDKIVEYITNNNLVPEWILESHIHADHLSGAHYLKGIYPSAKTAIGEGAKQVQATFKTIYNLEHSFPTDGSQFDKLFADGEQFQIGSLQVRVLSTPGHTPACISYYIENDCVFVGDTMFMPDVGSARCDFPNGSASVLWDSMKKVLELPEHVQVYVCHDYPPADRKLSYTTTIGEQRKLNKHIKDSISKDEFIKMRTERDATLKAPQLLLPSIQVNIRAGELPPKEDNGISYIKIPLNYLKQ